MKKWKFDFGKMLVILAILALFDNYDSETGHKNLAFHNEQPS